MLAALPEKKALIYFAGGVSKTGVDNQAQLEASINAAVKANVAIYPIDTRGLMADPPGGGASKGASRGSGIFNGSALQFAAHQDQRLAGDPGDAGGRHRRQGVPRQQRHRGSASQQAQQDLRSYYILGYYSTNAAEDGKFRKITVKLTNKLAAKLEHRPRILRVARSGAR